MKEESLIRSIDAVRALGATFPFTRDSRRRHGSLSCAGASVRRECRLGRDAVVLTGAMLDPRPAYAAADVVIGMGGSSLRGMASASPRSSSALGGSRRSFLQRRKTVSMRTAYSAMGSGTVKTTRWRSKSEVLRAMSMRGMH